MVSVVSGVFQDGMENGVEKRVRQGPMVLTAMKPVDTAATHRNVFTKMDYVELDVRMVIMGQYVNQFVQRDFMDKTVLTNATIRAMVVTLLMVYAILDAIQVGKGITAATFVSTDFMESIAKKYVDSVVT